MSERTNWTPDQWRVEYRHKNGRKVYTANRFGPDAETVCIGLEMNDGTDAVIVSARRCRFTS